MSKAFTIIVGLVFCYFFLIACKQKEKTSKEILIQIVDTTSSGKIVKDEPLIYHYNFDTLQGEKYNLKEGWIDTFTMDQRKFRIKLNERNDSLNVEYFLNNSWAQNASFAIYDEIDRRIDCNYDGYNDISSQSHSWNYINYYNPKRKNFSKQYRMPGDDEVLVDTLNSLYINYREPYHQCNSYNSQLLDYKNSEPRIYFLLSGDTYKTNGGCDIDSIEYLRLYSYHEKKDTLILLKEMKPKDPKKFDYITFWKANYKNLMKDIKND